MSNKITIIAEGHVTHKPVLYTTPEGYNYSYVKFAVNLFKNQEPMYCQVRVVRNTAKNCVEYLDVGHEISVTAPSLVVDSRIVDGKIKNTYKFDELNGKRPWIDFGAMPSGRYIGAVEATPEVVDEPAAEAITESEAKTEPVAVEVAAGEPLDDLPF